MKKYLGALAAAVALAAISAPGPAAAQVRQDPNIHRLVTGNVQAVAWRRHHWRHRGRAVIRPYWGPRYGYYNYYYRPYGAYAYPYPYYYAPGPHFRVGPRGFRFGWW